MANVLNLDLSWKFHRGDIDFGGENSHKAAYNAVKDGLTPGPGGKVFDDADWRVPDVPHDYLAESDFSPEHALNHGYKVRTRDCSMKTTEIVKYTAIPNRTASSPQATNPSGQIHLSGTMPLRAPF